MLWLTDGRLGEDKGDAVREITTDVIKNVDEDRPRRN